MKSESKHGFVSYDGTMLEGTMSVPDGRCEQLALLVHGITSSRDELGLFSGLAEHLNDKGVASFRFDYRCHGLNTQPIRTMTLAGVVNDIQAAFLCANDLLQPAAIHPVGMSFGGGVTAYWAANTDAQVKSVILLAPVIDYQQDVLGQHDLLDSARLSNAASTSLLNDGYVEIDGIQYGSALLNELPHINGISGLKRLQQRSLILHGDADSIVPYSLSAKFAELNRKCQLVNISGTDHGFGVPGDEDLTSAETKARHAEVFGIISRFILTEE